MRYLIRAVLTILIVLGAAVSVGHSETLNPGAPTPDYTYRAVVVSVYDGDTVRLDVDLGFSIWVRNEPIRLYGIDTPELRGSDRAAGYAARDRLREMIPDGTEIVVQTLRDTKGKYGRYLGVLWLGDLNLNQWMLDQGLAEPYLP